LLPGQFATGVLWRAPADFETIDADSCVAVRQAPPVHSAEALIAVMSEVGYGVSLAET